MSLSFQPRSADTPFFFVHGFRGQSFAHHVQQGVGKHINGSASGSSLLANPESSIEAVKLGSNLES
jgi:hypothetical protein